MKKPKLFIKSQNNVGQIRNVCLNCNKIFKKVLESSAVKFCSGACAELYERKLWQQ
jgi:hypothetical protein